MTRPRTVARGVELFPARTPTLPPATHTNSYALGEREVVLVEPATPHEDEQRAWLEWARAFPSQGRRLAAIALTHHHPDHVGGAALFARELGLPIWAHEATAARLPALPDVPTATELGIKDFVVTVFVGLWGPPKMPADAVAKANAAMNAALADPAVGSQIVKNGDMVGGGGAERLAALTNDNYKPWGEVARRNGVKAE